MKRKDPPHPQKPAGTQLPRQTNPPRRILVVFDDGDMRELSIEILVRSGYEVDAAANADAAWHALNTDRYDLLISDQKLRDMSGVDLVTKLRVARMAVPVILASTTLPRGKFTRYPWLQPAVTLPKPYTVAEFLRTVKEVLHSSESDPDSCAPLPNLRNPPSNDGSQP
jgi:two-component system nitrogen regulation response regulator GlnG